VIDLGPEGGEGGGEIIAAGTPEAIAANARSWTGKYLTPLLSQEQLLPAVSA
jgi:excinuclease ABC subunit A